MTKIKDLVEKYGNREVDEIELEKILKPVEKVKTIYNLKNGYDYYSLLNDGSLETIIWNNDAFDKQRLAIGNVFLTQEDAKFEVEYRKVKAELKRYASMCEEPIDWNNNKQHKYYLWYNHTYSKIEKTFEWFCSGCDIYFTNHSILEQAIEEIGAERIKKYYLGVKEAKNNE